MHSNHGIDVAMHTFELIAGLASIIGFGFSVGAFFAAKRASKAATEARDAVLIRTLADEIESGCHKMDDLLDLIAHDRPAEALRIAHELASALSEIPFRRGRHLSDDVANHLLNAREQVHLIERTLSSYEGQPASLQKKQRLIQICREQSMTMRENLGKIKAGIETGGAR